jgi:hypothetical protein
MHSKTSDGGLKALIRPGSVDWRAKMSIKSGGTVADAITVIKHDRHEVRRLKREIVERAKSDMDLERKKARVHNLLDKIFKATLRKEPPNVEFSWRSYWLRNLVFTINLHRHEMDTAFKDEFMHTAGGFDFVPTVVPHRSIPQYLLTDREDDVTIILKPAREPGETEHHRQKQAPKSPSQ